jgi:hypothetical protein
MSEKPVARQVPVAEAAADSAETLAEFKESFAYGSRTDLLFKYLKRFSAEQAARWSGCWSTSTSGTCAPTWRK